MEETINTTLNTTYIQEQVIILQHSAVLLEIVAEK